MHSSVGKNVKYERSVLHLKIYLGNGETRLKDTGHWKAVRCKIAGSKLDSFFTAGHMSSTDLSVRRKQWGPGSLGMPRKEVETRGSHREGEEAGTAPGRHSHCSV